MNETRATRAAARPVTAPARLTGAALLSRSARIISADEERLRAFGSATAPTATVISFAGGMPDSALFPTDAFRRVLNQVIREEGESLLQYYPVGRLPAAAPRISPAISCASASRRAPRRS